MGFLIFLGSVAAVSFIISVWGIIQLRKESKQNR